MSWARFQILPNLQIAENDYSKARLYRWINRLLRSGVSAKTTPGRPRSVRTKFIIAKIKRNVLFNKKRKPARKIARETDISTRTIQRIINVDLRFRAYKEVKVPALTSAHIDKRKSFFHWIRKWENSGISFIDPKTWPPYSPDLNHWIFLLKWSKEANWSIIIYKQTRFYRKNQKSHNWDIPLKMVPRCGP